MQLEKEINRVIKRIAFLDTEKTKSPVDIEEITNRVIDDVEKQNYDFTKMQTLLLQQNNRKRLVKQYPDVLSSENILCHWVKRILDKEFKIKYPNRNSISRSLFGIISALKTMCDYTIVKFDFKDFFNSLSAVYIFEKYIKNNIYDRIVLKTIEAFCIQTHRTYAGLPTSNAMAEIIATHFDDLLKREFAEMGLIYYERYIDDSVLILNRHVEEKEIRRILEDLLQETFFDKCINCVHCKTKYSNKKYRYISSRTISEHGEKFDYLGYEFALKKNGKNTIIKYGITKEKQEKYRRRLSKIIDCYIDPENPDYNDIELLRHRVEAFSSRVVYIGRKYKKEIWRVKGFISNYGELRFFLETSLLLDDTKNFLQNMIEDSFAKVPKDLYFMSGARNSQSGYCLYQNMKVNKTLLFVDKIGYDYKSLAKRCAQIGIDEYDSKGRKRKYNSLVREYLIKVRIGY